MSAVYIQAVKDLAANGTEADVLFLRLSDRDLFQIADQMQSDATLLQAVKHPNCLGLVDTYLLSLAA